MSLADAFVGHFSSNLSRLAYILAGEERERRALADVGCQCCSSNACFPSGPSMVPGATTGE
eukprot:97882-Hanusia_phi.AAC.1